MVSTEVALWPPTDVRGNELRIARFYEVPGWEVTNEQFGVAGENRERLFYVLEMDIHGTVTAKVLTGYRVGHEQPLAGRVY